MMTAGGDDGKYTEGTNILKKAAIGLVVIGWSWMLVSVVMWLIGNVWWGK
jgi:preprotein translocase subunit Sss1